MNFPLIANIVVFVVLLLLLAQARHKQWSLAKKVLVGLAMGVVFGLALQAIYGSDNPVLKDSIQWFNIVGNGYVQLLQMIVMPLVFASILSAVARLHNATQLGKISFLTIGTLLFTTLIAALVGVLVTNLFGLTAEGLVQGTAETARLTAIQTNFVGKVADLTVPQMVLSFVPKNPFADLTGASPTSIISVVIFAAAIVMLVTHAQTGLTVATIGVFIGAFSLLASGGEALSMIKKLDYKTLLFFIGLFVVVGGMEQTGVLNSLAGIIDAVSGNNVKWVVAIVLWLSALASAFVDNIPFAATMIPVIRSLAQAGGMDLSVLAWALSMGTDIGGCGTPIGASANVVGISVAAKNGHFIGWGKYCRYAAPATVLVILISMVCIYVRYF